jgi:uncharacterized membrane protein
VLPSLLITVGSPTETESLDSYPFLIAAGSLLTLILYPAVTYTYLHAAKGEIVNFKDAFSSKSYDKFWRFIGLGIVVSVVVILGLIAFIVPGIIFIRRYFLAPYYVMDRDMSIFDAMKASAKESKQFSGAVYGVLGVVLLIAMLSVFSLPGLVASAILTVLYATAPALRYLEIKKATHS